MSTNVARTADGWWVVSADALATPVRTTATTTAELLADREAVAAAAATDAGAVPVTDLELLSPVTTPARVVAQMVNYRSHAHDSGFDPDSVPPTFFRKSSSSVTGPTGDIVRPGHVRFLDYEVELGLVLGAPLPIGTEVTDEELGDYVAGLVVTDDVSAREIQLTRTQFYESKSYPTFTPVGPYLTLVDAAELRRLAELRLRLSVNGEVRQDSSVAEMIVRPARALSLLARFQPLAPGDLLLTGTPGGTALKAPHVVVEKIGALLPPKVKWKVFFDKQASNPRYLRDGDAVSARIATPDGAIDLGSQHHRIAVAP
ncbi:fumarylacetoacetate hydrolase family protein [Nocardioides sp.]|uniref:fumarylacetoacetate hydrolase family protein n=1 Tax=Nocardioides sp. TaxID=35761 RepID=UPI003784AE54